MALALRTTDELKRDLRRLQVERLDLPRDSARYAVVSELIDRTLDELAAARRP